MTLIITAVTKSEVVQVSDRRLTTPTGHLVDDEANKAVCVSCSDARFAIAYAGLAEIGRKRTDEWLADFLASIDAGGKNTKSICEAVIEHATSSLLQVPRERRGVTFALGGFRYDLPFLMSISNMEDEKGNQLTGVQDHFNVSVWLQNRSSPTKKADVIIHGCEPAVDETISRAIEKLRRKLFRRNGDVVARALVSLIRRAARDPQYGKYIGRSCMSVVVALEGDFRPVYHLEGASPEIYAPHLITGGAAFKGTRIWTGGGTPPWW